MKVYVTRWNCPGCGRQLEMRNGPYVKSFDDEETGPACSECATKLRRDISSSWLPDIILTFE